VIPGEYKLRKEPIQANENRVVKRLEVVNVGDRPIQVGSHFHFYEVNTALRFERKASFGYHLNIPAGTAVRFEPGDIKEIELVTFGGKQEVYGLNRKSEGSVKGDAINATNT
jgi:urease subunit beta